MPRTPDTGGQGTVPARNGAADGTPAPDADRTKHLACLRRAIRVSREALEAGNTPFGAILVGPDGRVLLEQGNVEVTGHDCTGHAEATLMRRASHAYDRDFLWNCTLYTTCEPCTMCSGAVYWGNVGTVVYGLEETRLLAFTGSDERNPTFSLPCREIFARGQKRITVIGPFPELEEEIAAVHRGYWKRGDIDTSRGVQQQGTARAGSSGQEDIRALEEALLSVQTRADARRVRELVADDFVEFCSSGRVYRYHAGDTFAKPGDPELRYVIRYFETRELAPGIVLARYEIDLDRGAGPSTTRRSSIWQRATDSWKILFHQGTPVGETGASAELG